MFRLSWRDYANHGWLQLAPGNGGVRNDPDYIYVDDGKINLKIEEKDLARRRVGIVYVCDR